MKTKIAASLVFVGVAVLVAVAAYLTQLAPSAPGDSDPDAVVYSGRLDSYLAVAPAILRAGQTENISSPCLMARSPLRAPSSWH